MKPSLPRKSLFGKFKRIRSTPFKQEDDGKHHEYSIRPDTFAFRVLNDKSIKVSDHPLQTKSFNALDYVFRNATNYPFAKRTPQDVYDDCALVGSASLGRLKHRPRKKKMLVSDFIEDSLYNPFYGYFSQEVEIFHTEKPFDYNNIADVDEFMDVWKRAYTAYDAPKQEARTDLVKREMALTKVDKDSKLAKYAQTVYKQDLMAQGKPRNKRSMQLWHTPTELFSPYYGEALARYIVINYKLNGGYPYDDLIIYEMGGGNGTLMCNILKYIQENEPDLYKRTQYKIIEILSQLAMRQAAQALKEKLITNNLDVSKLEIINESIFRWNKTVENPCFFIALEVFDNFAHDLIRYDAVTGEPYEGHVLVDAEGDFYEFFTPQLSYYSNACLNLRENSNLSILKQRNGLSGRIELLKSIVPFTDKSHIHPLHQLTKKMALQNWVVPLKDNLTPGEFIPTRLLQFFQILKHRFPNHSLISSDFNYLPNTIPNYYNGPVVQTVVQDKMVDVTLYMCHQGYFDIMFPTNFDLANEMYRRVTGKLARVELHKAFLEQWADVDATTTQKGENPMLDFYKNVSFMVS